MSSSCLNSSDTVHLRITMPEYPDVQKVMPFSPDDTIWTVKQRFLQNLKKDLIDGQNYGLYIPPASCRSGKFLDEERCLREYPLTGAIKYFEQTQFKYKNRIKFSFDISSMKLKKVNTLSNQKEFIEWVLRGEGDKIARLLNKGFNPNYNNVANGETPLTLATTLTRPRSMLISLVSGGAFLDYRNKNGQTPLHTAVIHKNKDAMRTLLDLGSSPNYKDKDNLTPLFLSCMNNNNLQLISMLLHERAQLQCRDRHGYTELHYACKHGNKDLVEQFVFYGSDLNSQDHNGDTPLHICASSNNRDCCEVLLIRGADKNITNNNGKTASKLSHYTSNPQLIRLIEDFKTEDIVYFEDLPVYNDKRRGALSAATIRSLEKSRSNPNLHLLFANQPSSTISAASLNTLANQSSNPVTKNYTSGFLIPNGSNIRSRPNDKRLSAMELEWNGDKKDKNVNKETFQTLYDEKSFLIKKSEKGLGFAIKNIELNEANPCRQIFNEVYYGKAAADAGLMAGDYLFEINGQNVKNASHEECVKIVKSAKNSIQIKVLRRISVKEDKPTINENKDSYTNKVYLNKKKSLEDQGETSTELKVSKDSGDILKNNYIESKAVLENNQPKKDDKVDGKSFTTTTISSSTNTTSTTSNSISKPKLSATDLQASVPIAPPLPPDIETLRKSQAREMPNLVESVSHDQRSQTNTLKKIDVNSPLPNEAHNVLFEAIKRRKQLVDDVGSDNLSASIESKVNQSKKLNSLTKTSVIAFNKEKSKHHSFVPQNSPKQQNYGLLASESKTLGKPPKSPFNSNDSNSVYKPSNKSKSEYSPIYQAKTLPKKGSRENLESEPKEGFTADAEKLRLMFIEKKFNSTKIKTSPEIKEENNFINPILTTDSINIENDVLSKPSIEEKQTVVETYVEPLIITNNDVATMDPVFKEHKDTNNHNENNENSLNEKEAKEINSLQNVNLKIEKPKLALDTTLTNGIQKAPASPSPSIGALATIVAEKAQQKQDSNRQIQEPSSGTSRIFSAGNTLTKNKSSSSPTSPKIADIKPLSVLYTSQTSPTTKKPFDKSLSKPTSVSAVNLSTNKKVYTSVTKTSPSPPSKGPISSIGNDQKEKSFESAKFVFQSANVSMVNKSNNESNKPPFPKLVIQNKSTYNNVTSNSKAIVAVSPKSPPATHPKTFLNNNKAVPSKVYSPKTNGIHSNTENKHVSNMTANYNGNTKKTKSASNFVKSYSDTTDAAKKPSDFKEVQITSSKVLTPVSPKVSNSPETAFPTLRKKPQQTNTLVFKAKPNSTPNSPPSRKF